MVVGRENEESIVLFLPNEWIFEDKIFFFMGRMWNPFGFKYSHFSKEKISLPFLKKPFLPSSPFFPLYLSLTLKPLIFFFLYIFHPFCNTNWIRDHYKALIFLTERPSSPSKSKGWLGSHFLLLAICVSES